MISYPRFVECLANLSGAVMKWLACGVVNTFQSVCPGKEFYCNSLNAEWGWWPMWYCDIERKHIFPKCPKFNCKDTVAKPLFTAAFALPLPTINLADSFVELVLVDRHSVAMVIIHQQTHTYMVRYLYYTCYPLRSQRLIKKISTTN